MKSIIFTCFVILSTCILTASNVSEALAQGIRHGDVVDGIPVGFYNGILDGWSASEHIVTAQEKEIGELKNTIDLQGQELMDKDSVSVMLIRKDSTCEVDLVYERNVNATLLKQLSLVKVSERKPFFLDPKTYFVFFGGVFLGAYLEGKAR